MRRLFTAAVSAAIMTTAWSPVNAGEFVSGIEYYTRYIAVPPQYYRLPFVTRIPGLVANAFYSPNNRTSFDSICNLSGVIQYVTGIRQQCIPEPSFGKCNINNLFKTCF
jgi:hypothetical protein